MADDEKAKETIDQDFMVFYMHQGKLDRLIELLDSDIEISREVRAGISTMLKEDLDSDYQLVCKRRANTRGRPKKSELSQVCEVNMGCKVLDLVEDGAKYEVAVRIVAKQFQVSVPTVEKAYSYMKRKVNEDD